MDDDGGGGEETSLSSSRGGRHRRNASEIGGGASAGGFTSPSSKPSKLRHRSKTSGAEAGVGKNLTSWLRGGRGGPDNPSTHGYEQDDGGGGFTSNMGGGGGGGGSGNPHHHNRSQKRNKKKNKIQRWPYDDYHEVQQKYYDDMGEESDEDNPEKMKEDLNVFERPMELEDIKTAVKQLSLVDFEKKAESRAVAIVSSWLFDSGLIDELLVNGGAKGMPTPAPRSDASVRSQEGVEVNAHGFPVGVDGGLKIEKEIEKLRNHRLKELSTINTRLNEGVAASGAEVQELVNAVENARGDLGNLRQLSTYIAEGVSSSEGNNTFILSRYPKLKLAINARRNLFKVFRELEFFSQIPATCERLREELHSGEWTQNEWSTIRSVCMEHVELEILLVEAEAEMKARLSEEDGDTAEVEETKNTKSLRASRRHKRADALLRSAKRLEGGNAEAVDNFLKNHIKNVWELGDEIRMKILSGIGSAFDLALNNPAGMVALIEAVEVYERAADQYKVKYGERQTLYFTDMKSEALATIYKDFELRGLEVFRQIQMQAADKAVEENAHGSQFNAVLRAATELVAEIILVKNEMAPCFPPDWQIEILWSSCVAHVCSNQIIQHIGGPEGNLLNELTVTQLLDLVAWVEYFREQIEESFPQVAELKTTEKEYFDQKPDLFRNKKEIDMERATDSLAWVNNMLWEVHRLAQDEFLMRTRDQTNEWLENVYTAEHTKNQTNDGRLNSSLCEDVFSLVGVQLRTLREHLSKKSDALVMAICLIFTHLKTKQTNIRDSFLQDLETCCAAANDFTRMSEKCEDNLDELLRECDFAEESAKTLEASSSDLLALYSADAVYAAQYTHVYIFEPIHEAIGEGLFGEDWEVDLTENELALTLVRTLEDYQTDLEQFLEDMLIGKTFEVLVAATVVFYVKCLLEKAESHTSNRESKFKDLDEALRRMSDDIRIMREYFEKLTQRFPLLQRVIDREFESLTTIHTIMDCAVHNPNDAADFVPMLHKKVGDVDLTKRFIGDLWHLINPSQEKAIWELVDGESEFLKAFNLPEEEMRFDRSKVPGTRLNEMMAEMYIESKRKLPAKKNVIEEMKKGFQSYVVKKEEY